MPSHLAGGKSYRERELTLWLVTMYWTGKPLQPGCETVWRRDSQNGQLKLALIPGGRASWPQVIAKVGVRCFLELIMASGKRGVCKKEPRGNKTLRSRSWGHCPVQGPQGSPLAAMLCILQEMHRQRTHAGGPTPQIPVVAADKRHRVHTVWIKPE